MFLLLLSSSFLLLYLKLVMLAKEVDHELTSVPLNDIDEWTTSHNNMNLPALWDSTRDVTISNPIRIAEYLDKFYPANSLTRLSFYSYQEALDRIQNILPALTRYIQNKDTLNEIFLLHEFINEFKIVDELLKSKPGVYLCGEEVSLADWYLFPVLYHAWIAVEHFKGFEIFDTSVSGTSSGSINLSGLEQWLEVMWNSKEFNDPSVFIPSDEILTYWKMQRGDITTPM
jgi:glutathione S-transferase